MESWESSQSVVKTPKKNHPHSLSSSSDSAIPHIMVATPEPRQIRILKADLVAFDSGSDLPNLGCEVATKPDGFQKCPSSLPQKYEMLCELFNAMISSIRLLRLKRGPPTLTQLSRNIESLTKRRFTVHHLAQLKHILPEVIVVKKILVQDRETNCMKEELLVSLEVDAVETNQDMDGSGGFSLLKGILRSRLIEYSRTHHGDDEIPKGELPWLFYQPKQEPEPIMCITPTPLAVLHSAPSFKRRFSSRALGAPVSESSSVEPSPQFPETPVKVATSSDTKDGSFSGIVETNVAPLKLAFPTPAKVVSTPAKLASTPAKLASTPAKLASTPARLMAATPALLPRKRQLMTPDHEYSDLPDKSPKRSRVLNFEQSSNVIEDDVVEERNYAAQGSVACMDLLEEIKEQHILEKEDPVASQAKRQQQMMAGVSKLFDMILLLFQSIRQRVVTKEELVYKLITGHLDIVDRREVEEQLELLHEVAPECMTELHSSSGDALLRLNKLSCSESIRAKLLEAQEDYKSFPN